MDYFRNSMGPVVKCLRDSGIGKKVESGKVTLAQLDAYAQGIKAPTLASGRQEMLENLINEYIR